MFCDLDWPINECAGLSASAELLFTYCGCQNYRCFFIGCPHFHCRNYHFRFYLASECISKPVCRQNINGQRIHSRKQRRIAQTYKAGTGWGPGLTLRDMKEQSQYGRQVPLVVYLLCTMEQKLPNPVESRYVDTKLDVQQMKKNVMV